MPADDLCVAQTRAWLEKARSDPRAAETMASASPPLFGHAVFHPQKSVEKALKALLVWHDQPFRKTRSLEELGRLWLALDPSLGTLVDRVTYMSAYAWMYRYPGPAVPLGRSDVADAIADARAAIAAISSHLRRFTTALDHDVDGGG